MYNFEFMIGNSYAEGMRGSHSLGNAFVINFL